MSILAPVVVKPEAVSKTASVNDGIAPDIINGSEPTSVQEVFDEKKDIPHEA